MTSMTSMRLTREDAEIFCAMMHLASKLLDQAKHEGVAVCGMLTVRYNSSSEPHAYTFCFTR